MTDPFEPPENFLGLPEGISRRDRSAVIVLPIPYEQTTSFGAGAREGPRAILRASRSVELYDEESGEEAARAGIHTLPAIETDARGPEAMRARIADVVASVFTPDRLLVALGGEHSVTPGIVDGVARRHREFTVVQFDAHADLRDEYQGSRMSHACAMRRVLETHPLVSVGIRSLSAEEAAFARERRLRSIPAAAFADPLVDVDAAAARLVGAIETEAVYVTFDLDAFDPSILPATGTPEPGGLGWYATLRLLAAVARERRVIAFDVVELAPIPGQTASDCLAAKLAYRLIGFALASRRRGPRARAGSSRGAPGRRARPSQPGRGRASARRGDSDPGSRRGRRPAP